MDPLNGGEEGRALDEALSPEREFENDVLDGYGYEEPEPIPSDDADGAAEAPPDVSEPEVEQPVADEQPVEQDNFNLKADPAGNLINQNGQIVAKAGSERRVYEKAQKLEGDVARYKEEIQRSQDIMFQANAYINNLKKENEELKNNSLAGQYGINPQEQQEALSVYAKLKDPNTALEGAKYILTQLAARGIDIKSLGATNAAIDPTVLAQSITGQINQKLEPISERFNKEGQQQAERQAKIDEANAFFNRNPEAGQYAEQLGRMLSHPQFQGMHIAEAWSKLQAHLWHQQQQQASQPAPQEPQSQASEPRPSGLPSPMASRVPNANPDNSPVHADLDYRDIVKGVLADYGDVIT